MTSHRPRLAYRLLARAVRSTSLVDRGARFFDRMRSQIILAAGSDEFVEAFNEVAYSQETPYRTDEEHARRGLFEWEERLVKTLLPPAPARILLGGAGGGREALALADRGYAVTAFEPVPRLVESLVRVCNAEPRVEPLQGQYTDLPVLRDGRSGQPVDLAARPAFDAALFGWISFCHGKADTRRVDALRKMASLTNGPVIISYFAPSSPSARRAYFSVWIGYCRELSHEDLHAVASAAGLRVDHIDDAFSFAALRAR